MKGEILVNVELNTYVTNDVTHGVNNYVDNAMTMYVKQIMNFERLFFPRAWRSLTKSVWVSVESATRRAEGNVTRRGGAPR